MIKYEVIEVYYGSWCGSCGLFDQLHDAVERKLLLDSEKESVKEHFHIIVRLPKENK